MLPFFPQPRERPESFENDSDFDEKELIDSFKKLKIVDLPKFQPNRLNSPKNSKTSKRNANYLSQNNQIFDFHGNLLPDFLSKSLQSSANPNVTFKSKDSYDFQKMLFKIANNDNSKEELVNDSFNEEEDVLDENSQYFINNEYPYNSIDDDAYSSEYEKEDENDDINRSDDNNDAEGHTNLYEFHENYNELDHKEDTFYYHQTPLKIQTIYDTGEEKEFYDNDEILSNDDWENYEF